MRTRKNTKGFTIIELMIVLAIGGVILGLVLFAIPALQRNARNQQTRLDVSNLVGLLNDYQTNNNGGLPTWVSHENSTGYVNMGTGPVVTASSTNNIGRIRAGVTITTVSAATMPTALGSYNIAIGFKCGSNGTIGAASNRSIAVGYLIETGGGTTSACTES